MTYARKIGPPSSRRRLLQTLPLLAACHTPAQAQTNSGRGFSVEDFRSVSNVFGNRLTDERLEAIKPALDRQFAQLESMRRFELDEQIEPATLFQANR